MATTLTATFQNDYGFVRLIATGVPNDMFIFRESPVFEGGTYRLPAFNYDTSRAEQRAADYLVPLGSTVTYVVRPKGGGAAVARETVTTPSGVAYLRHLFFPRLAMRLRVVEFNDSRPSRLTTYAISGQRNAAATWDMRAGRDASLRIALASFPERQRLEQIINSGSPVSLAMCMELGNEPGLFAVGDISFERYGKADRWVATLALTEVDMPRILGYLEAGQIPGTTYDEREAELGVGRTYDDAKARWPYYYQAIS